MMVSQLVNKFSLPFLSISLILFMAVASADWPQYQGANRDGISTETEIARVWPAEGLKAEWSVPVGKGFGSPAIRDGEVFVLDRIVGESDTLRCYSLETGKELWNFTYAAPSQVSYPGSRTSPTVTEKYVYTVGVMGDLYCFDRKTHKPVWQHNIIEKFSSKAVPNWGVSQAPSVYDDLVIVAPQSPNASVAAFNRSTGEMLWASPGIAGVGYVSPVVTTLHGVDQVLMINPAGRREPTTVSGISLEDGSVLWRYKDWNCRIPIPFPAVLPNNRVFVTGGYEGGSALFEVTKKGKEFGTKTVFETMEFGSQIHQPLLLGGVLYGNSNSNNQKDGMSCLTLDGMLKWSTKGNRALPNFGFGTLLSVDGLILNLEGNKGTLHLIEPSQEGYKELASAKVLTGKQIWAPMAFSGGKLVLRSQSELKCIDLRNP
jgi:outer membrane protein assembly factor BamB